MNEETKKIRVELIFEIIGKPAEHLSDSLNILINKLGEEKGISIINKKIHEPVLMKDQKEFYTSFSEVEIEVEEMLYLAAIIFKYMPSHIEVISPEKIVLTNNDCGEILSEIARKLHAYDKIVRVSKTEKIILEKKLKELMPKKENGAKNE